jgi:hypothetical protein
MSAARGAEQFYTIEHHSSRSEGLELARYLDIKVRSLTRTPCLNLNVHLVCRNEAVREVI